MQESHVHATRLHERGFPATAVAASFSKRPRATACVAMLSGMTKIPSPHDAPPLLTDDDVKRRVEALVGPALRDRTLWLLFIDGDRRQAPVVMPINDLPRLPDGVITGLGSVLEGVLPDLATAAGPGSVVFVRERLGPDYILPADRVWAEVLATMCRARRIVVRGTYLTTPGGGTRRLS
jgi:hypothetical protein